MLENNGVTWQVTTLKRHGGKVSTIAQAGTYENSMFSFMMFGSESVTIISEVCNATERAIRDQHFKALAIFDVKKDELPKVEPEDVLKVGQIVWLNGYGQDKYSHDRLAVYEINGSTAKCVNLDKFMLSHEDHIRPESKIFGIGMYFTPGDVADPLEIGEAIRKSREMDIVRKDEAAAGKILEAARVEAVTEELLKEYPYMKPNPQEQNEVTTNIRAILKNKFPGITFSVVKEHYGTVNIKWSDGPSREAVEKIVKMFNDYASDQSGDYWDHAPTDFSNLFGSMKFIFCARNMSQATEAVLMPQAEAIYNVHTFGCHCKENLLLQIFSRSELPAGAKVTGLKRTEYEAGHVQDLYTIEYEAPKPAATIEPSEGVTVTHNEEKNGVEIRFSSKPEPAVLDSLKANGWKWSRFNSVWYNRYSAATWEFAQSLILQTA